MFSSSFMVVNIGVSDSTSINRGGMDVQRWNSGGWWASIPILLQNAVFLALIILASSLLVAAAVAGLDMFGLVYVSW